MEHMNILKPSHSPEDNLSCALCNSPLIIQFHTFTEIQHEVCVIVSTRKLQSNKWISLRFHSIIVTHSVCGSVSHSLETPKPELHEDPFPPRLFHGINLNS